jgi:hypothetical protein
LGKRVGVGDMVMGETLGRLCCPQWGRRCQRRSPSRRPRWGIYRPSPPCLCWGEIPWFPLWTMAALRHRSPSWRRRLGYCSGVGRTVALGGGHGDSDRFSLVRLRSTALVRCYDCASSGGVLGVALWASLVAALGSIALCFIVLLGELFCLSMVRRPPIQGEGQGVLSGGGANGALSLLPGWCRRWLVPGDFPWPCCLLVSLGVE